MGQIIVDKVLLQRVVYTLKQLDIRGYDSMDKLVGIVLSLEQCLETAKPYSVREETEDKEE